MSSNEENQRRNPRLNCKVPVEGQEGGVFDQIEALDISEGGLGFISKKDIPVGQEIPIELDLAENGEQPVLVIGKVLWSRPMEGLDTYRVGVAFEEYLNESQSRLKEYFPLESE